MAFTTAKDRLRAGWAGLLALSTALAALGGFSPGRSAAFEADNEPAPRVQPIYHKDRSFGIPFKIDEQSRRQLKEVQLWVSEDSGFNWRAASKTTPEQGKFIFRARRDGEYWFATRALSVDGRYSPPEDQPIRPTMIVIIDSTEPSLVLEPDGRRGGVLRARWEVKDENLDLNSLALEYQVAGAREWRKVPLSRPALLGSQSWDANTVDGVRVRASVADKAGNVAEKDIYFPEGAGATAPDLASVDQGDPFAPPIQRFGRRDDSPIAENPSFPPVEDDFTTAPRPGARRPIARQTGAGAAAMVGSNPGAFPPGPDWDRGAGGGRPAFSAPAPSTTPGPGPTGSAAPAPRFPDPFPDPGGGGGAAGSAFGAPGSGPSGQADPGESGSMLVNSPRFKLQYEVEDAGPGGPATVELWMTRDGGRTWIRRGEDPDRVSPFDVDLGGEGTFGITLVARSASGLGDRPPAPGDPPQTWVEVDSTPPTVQLYPPQVGSGVHTGKVAISWRADDLHLADRSVSLSWRPDNPGSAWQPIPGGQSLENTDQFIWVVPPDLPPKFHVRVEAVDTAGNRGAAETPAASPVIVDRSRPRSRILGLDTDVNTTR